MSIKKYSSGSWVDIPYKKFEAATDTITTFPKQIIADGQSASAVIKGNLSQSGTPTPSSPIYPTECGDMVASGEHSGQYQIPILSGGVTTPVYLGEVQSTRQIKKLVLTGEETGWNTNGSGDNKFFYFPVVNETVSGTTAFCNQYTQENIGSSTTDVGIGFAGTTQFRIRPNNPSQYTALSDFTNYVKGLYQSGTPIIIWYVLATPTTTTLNEPIRKIGTYTDSVSVTNIPTTGTAEQFDISTTLKPSEVDLTYHGWHEHSDTKF